MRFGLRSGLLAAAALTLCSGPAGATDITIPGKIGIIKDTKLFKIVSKPAGTFSIPAFGGSSDPTINTSSLEVFDSDNTGSLSDPLTGGGWQGLGNPAGSKGYKYKNTSAPSGGAVKIIILKPTVIKILAKDDGTLDGPIGGNLGVELDTGSDRYCADFGGTNVKDQAGLWKEKDAPAPTECLSATPPGCCNDDAFVNFTNYAIAGDCGDVVDSSGVLVTNIACGSVYAGGGDASIVPINHAAPDQGSLITAISSCSGDVATIGAATSVQTGSNRNCTDAGCLFGAPRPVPNAGSTPTSICILPQISTGASGTLDCSTGATNLSLPVSWSIYFSGDISGDPGIQPCPRCISGACVGGDNNGGSCTAGTTALSPAYPTSRDCPPTGGHLIGSVPIAFTLSSSTVTWTATVATNDVITTAGQQSRTFSGYCRDRVLPGGSFTFKSPAQKCWENGMAVGPACGSDTFETCEQRNQGAFGPNGGANMTIRAIGNAMSVLGGPAGATLVSIYSIPPLFDGFFDGLDDWPGPGAVALPGTARTCSDAMSCP